MLEYSTVRTNRVCSLFSKRLQFSGKDRDAHKYINSYNVKPLQRDTNKAQWEHKGGSTDFNRDVQK